MKSMRRINLLVLLLSIIVGLCPMRIAAEDVFLFSYLGQDTATQNHWEGKYGRDGYVLLGYRYREEMGDNSLKELERPYIKVNNYDLIGGKAIKSLVTTNSDGLLGVNGNMNGKSIDMPSENAADSYEVSAIAFNKSETGDILHDGMCEFAFELNDDDEKVFSVYGHESSGYGSVVYQFCDITTRNVIYSKTFTEQPARNGNYACFRVKGSFILRILTQGRQNTVSAFFFDDVQSNSAQLAISTDKINNFISIVVDDKDAALTHFLIRQDGKTAESISQSDGVVKNITDETTIGKSQYIYTLYQYGTNGFSKSKDFRFTTPVTSDLTIELSELNSVYTADDIIPINVSVKAGALPVRNATIKLMLEGDYITRKMMDPLIAEIVTDDLGNARFDYQVKVAGEFGIYALVEQNYTIGYSRSKSDVKPVSIRLKPYKDVPFILKMSDAIKYDELISVTGEGYYGDLQVKAVAFAGDENTPSEPPEDAIDVEILQKDELNAQFMTIKFPKDAPSGLYSIWVKNDYGWSKPYTLNEQRANFISEYEVRYGMEIQVSGRNLDLRQINHKEHYTSVRLNDGRGNAYVQELTKVTPYSINFKVDERTPLGTYDVEVTNNGGLSWTGLVSTETQRDARKQTLTVLEACEDPIDLGLAWVANYKWNNRFNVLDYGANNKDKDGDFEAINKAITAAHDAGGGVVYIPNGTYYYDNTIPLRAGVVLLGESTEKTILYYNGEDGKNIAASTDDGQTEGCYGMAYFTIKAFDENTHPTGIWHGNAWSSAHDQEKRTAREIFMKGVNIELNIYRDGMKDFSKAEIDTIMDERYAVQDCNIRIAGGMPCVYVNKYIMCDNTEFGYGAGCVLSNAMYSFITNTNIDHVTEYPSDAQYPHNTHAFFGRSYIHWENCNVKGLGYWGDSEAFCSETPNAHFGLGKVLSAESNKIYTFSEGPYIGDAMIASHPQTIRNSYLAICIMSGRGAGQLRAVTAFDPKGKWFEVEEPWDILPDSSSIFTFVCPNDRTTVYKSDIDHAGTIASFYGVGWDCVVDSIKGHNVCGVNTHNTNVTSANRLSFGYFLAYRNCEMSGSMQAISGYNSYNGDAHKGEMGALMTNYRNETTGKFAGIIGYAQDFRNVKIILDPDGRLYEPTHAAINYRTTSIPTDDKKGDISNIIIENCYTEGGEYGIAVASNVGNGIIVRNFKGEKTSTGIAVNIPEGTENYLCIDDGGPANSGETITYNTTTSSTVSGTEIGFEDLDNFGWAKEDIETARKRKITNGTSVGKFSPEKTVTRAEFFGFIVKAMGVDLVEYKNAFSDVSKTSWYARYIQTAYTNALIDNTMIKSGKINPEAPITREEMAGVLAKAIMNKERTLNINAESAGFSDMNSISSAYVGYVNIVKKYGVVIGEEGNKFNPKALANRAEAVVTVNRFFSHFEEAEESEQNPS